MMGEGFIKLEQKKEEAKEDKDDKKDKKEKTQELNKGIKETQNIYSKYTTTSGSNTNDRKFEQNQNEFKRPRI